MTDASPTTSFDRAEIVDSHVHVVDPGRFPYVRGEGYPPPAHETGDAGALEQVLAGSGITHCVVVQPSCYANDNRALVDALRQDPAHRRGIAGVDVGVTEAELHSLASHGVVGIRINCVNFDHTLTGRAPLGDLLRRVAARDWLIEAQVRAFEAGPILRILERVDAIAIFDHFGYPALDRGCSDATFRNLLSFCEDRHAFIKLSGFERLSGWTDDTKGVDPFVEMILERLGPGKCVWGSDWPHVNRGNGRPPAHATQLAQLARWLPDTGDRRRVLWETPRRLFGFER